MKKIFCALVILCVMVSCARGAYYDEGNDGDSWETAYVIDSVEDIKLMRDRTNDGTEASGKYYKLASDIDLSAEVNWVGIGDGIGSGASFMGHFDGQNHTVSLNVDSSDILAGLFHTINTKSGDIAVRKLNIKGTVKGSWAGGLAWCIDSGVIENCTFDGNVHSYGDWAGGFVDLMWGGTIRNCTFNGKVSSSTNSGGGFVAELYSGNIEHCTVAAGSEVSGISYAGGIIGLMHGGYVRNCTTSVALNQAKSKGGIVGGATTKVQSNLSGNEWPNVYTQIGLVADDIPDDPSIILDNPVTASSHKYTVFNLAMTWDEAKAYCENLGGHLATISSQEEQNLVETMILSGDKYSYWLGGRQNSSGAWSWVDGSAWSYTNWAEGMPDGSGEVLHIYAETPYTEYYTVGKWDDTDSSAQNAGYLTLEQHGFICEWEPVQAEFAPLNSEYLKYIADPASYLESGEFYGELPDPVEYSHLSDNPAEASSLSNELYASDTLPAKYDPRSTGKISSVKNQNPYGTCWSFASLGAMETNILYQSSGTVFDLSELHQAWFAYNDPREGYAFKVYNTNESILDQGGNLTMSLAFLSRAGTATENELPYSQAANVQSLTNGKYPEDYSNPLRLKDVHIVGDITSSNRDEVKRLIMKYGALRISFQWKNSGFSSNANTYYSTGSGGGHAVIITGWDDNVSTPGGKGAWLVKNSWVSAWGDSGFCWMSYSQNIYNAAVFVADSNSQGLKCRGYDQLGTPDTLSWKWSANIFVAEGNETIKEIAFHTRDNNVSYEVYINKLGKSRPVNPGTPSSPVASGTFPYTGYHSVSLNSTIDVEDGEYFSVIVKLTGKSGYEYYSAVESPGTFRAAAVHVGESYFASTSGTPSPADWKDGKTILNGSSARPCNACIKVFTVTTGNPPTPTPSPTPQPTPTPNNIGSSSGGGGCASFTALFSAIAVAFTLRRKH